MSEMFSTVVYGLVIGLAVTGALLGFIRGISRQTMKFITVAAAFMLSLLIYTGAYPWLQSFCEDKSLLDIAQMLGLQLGEQVNGYLSVVRGEAALYVTAIPMAAVVYPLLFVVTFISISGMLVFPYMVICGVLGFTEHANNPATRIMGSVLGALQGLLVATIVLVPVGGMVNVAEEAITIAEENHPEFKNTQQMSDIYDEYIEGLATNPILDVMDEHFGFIYEDMTTIDVNGEDVKISTAVDDLVELYVYYGELGVGTEAFDYKNLSVENKATIDDMIACFGDDKLMTVIMSNAFQSVGMASESGVLDLRIDEPLNSLMRDLLKSFMSSEEDTVEADIQTFADVYYLMSTEGVFLAGDINQMFLAFLTLDENGTSAFNRMCAILELNPRYAHLSDTLSSMAMDMLLQSSGVDQDTLETIEEVKGTVNNVLAIDKESFETEEEYKAAVNSEISSTLEENGIALDEEQMNTLTDYIIEEKEVSGKTEFSDADMADFMSKYYDIYANGSGSGDFDLPEIPELP